MLLNCGVGEDSWESLGLQGNQPVHPKGDQSWVFIGRTDAEAETPILWPPHAKSWLTGKDPDAGRDWGQEEKGMREDEMAWMASSTWCTWVWVNSRSWWWTGRPGMLQFMGSQRVGHDWATELNWTELSSPGIWTVLGLLWPTEYSGNETVCFQGWVIRDDAVITLFARTVMLGALSCHIRNPTFLRLSCLAPSQTTWSTTWRGQLWAVQLILLTFSAQAWFIAVKGPPNDSSPQSPNHPSALDFSQLKS